MTPRIEIIVPTLASAERSGSLRRALSSIFAQDEVRARPVVVVNGTRFDSNLLEELKGDKRVRLFYLSEPSQTNAVRFGVSQIEAEYFGFLDDDDEFLPGALAARAAALSGAPGVDCAVSNGLRDDGGAVQPIFDDMSDFAREPLMSLVNGTWLASCGGLFRAETVGVEFFDPAIKFLEWTYLSFRIASTRKVVFLDEPGYIVHSTPGSLSKSDAYLEGMVSVLHRIMKECEICSFRRQIRPKYLQTLATISRRKLAQGNRKAFFYWYFRCTFGSMSVRYIPIIRHLFTCNDGRRRR